MYIRNGSIIVVIMVIMMFLAGTIITTLIATHKLSSLAQFRITYQQQSALLEGLLRAGVAYCCDHRVDLFSSAKQRKISISFDPWPCAEIVTKMGHYSGLVTINSQKKEATIEAALSHDKLTRRGSCTVSLWDGKVNAKNDSKLRISNWVVDAKI